MLDPLPPPLLGLLATLSLVETSELTNRALVPRLSDFCFGCFGLVITVDDDDDVSNNLLLVFLPVGLGDNAIIGACMRLSLGESAVTGGDNVDPLLPCVEAVSLDEMLPSEPMVTTPPVVGLMLTSSVIK